MKPSPFVKSLILLFVGLIGLPGESTALAQRTLPDSDESPFQEDPGGFGEMDAGTDGRARARREPRRRSTESRAPDGSRRTTRARADSFDSDAPFGRPDEDFEEEFSQKVVLNDRLAGWNEASDGLGNRRVGEMLRANWVMVGATGILEGSVRPIDDAQVPGMTVYLMNKGRLVKTSAVQDDGSFRFNNVRRGAYSLIGWGNNAFFAFGMNVLGYVEDAEETVPTSITTYAFQNRTTINTDWIRYFTPAVTYRVFGRYEYGERASDPDNLYGVDGLTRFQPPAIPSTSIAGTPVSLTSDGRFIGRVHQLRSLDGRPVDVRSTKVMLLKQDSVVASSTTDNFGVFEFEGVPPGQYGLLAAGVDGVGLTGLEVVDSSSVGMDDDGEMEEVEGEPFDFCLTPSEMAGWLNHYADEVAYQRSILAPRPPKPGDMGNCPYCSNGTCGANGICGSCGQGRLKPEDAPCQCHRRDLTFAQWQQLGCARYQAQGLGVAKAARRVTDRIDEAFERTFYPPSETGGITGGPAPGANNAATQYPGYNPGYSTVAPPTRYYAAPYTAPRMP